MDIFEEEVKTGFEGGAVRVGFAGFGFERFRKGEKVDPKIQASYNLNKTLEKYPNFSKESRTEIQNEFANFPNLQVLNLETLASVLNFLKFFPDPKPKDFKNEVIVVYFSRLIPDKSLPVEEMDRLILRLKAQFLKYIVAVNEFRREQEEEFEEEEEQKEFEEEEKEFEEEEEEEEF